MTEWLHEVLGMKKRDDYTRGVELRGIRVEELSAVDSPAHGFDHFLLVKASEAPKKLTDLSDTELDNRIADLQRALQENPSDLFLAEDLAALKRERERRNRLDKSAPQEGWGSRLVAGQRIVFK
jgi:hypothetical protein